MKFFIRNLSPRAEFCLVLVIAFGLPMCMVGMHLILTTVHFSHVPFLREMSEHYGTAAAPHSPRFSNASLLGVVIYELAVLAVVSWIGRLRNWSFQAFGFQVSWAWTGVGVLLFIVAAMLYQVLVLWIFLLIPAAGGIWPSPSAVRLAWPLIVLNSVANSVFEEWLEAGYVIRSLRGCGAWIAILSSAFLRFLLHAHLGAAGSAAVFAIGVIFGLAYWRWRQMWPLIVAHACMNFCAFLYSNHAA